MSAQPKSMPSLNSLINDPFRVPLDELLAGLCALLGCAIACSLILIILFGTLRILRQIRN